MPNKLTVFAMSGSKISFAEGQSAPNTSPDELGRVQGELNFAPKEEGFVKFPNKRPGQTFVITAVTPETNDLLIVYVQDSNEDAPDADLVY
jgi:hypothetical protein